MTRHDCAMTNDAIIRYSTTTGDAPRDLPLAPLAPIDIREMTGDCGHTASTRLPGWFVYQGELICGPCRDLS